MGFEESRKHLLSLTYHELQCLCKRYNLPANKTHTQLASSLASLLEESLATSPASLATVKEVSTCGQINHKRGPYTGRDDIQLHAKHQKGPQTAVGEASKRSIEASTSISPVPINSGRSICHDRSSLEPGKAHNVQCQNGVGAADKTTYPEIACEHHGSPANIISQISAPVFQKHPAIDNGTAAPSGNTKDATDNGCGPSDVRSVNASHVQFIVMSDEGINLVVDLNSSPLDLAEKFKSEVSVPPSDPGNLSSFFSSLVSKDDHSTVSPSGNMVVDIQSKEAESNTHSTNSSLGSDVGDNSRSELYPADTATVNTVSSASTFPGTSVELSGYQVGAPVVSSSCLTAEVTNNKVSDMMVCALDKETLPQESIDVLPGSERIPANLADASEQPTGNKDMKSPGKTKVLGNIGCIQNVSVADTDNLFAFSLGDVVRSGSNELSSKTARKQTVNVPEGAQLAQNGDTHRVLMEPVEAMAVEGDTVFGDRLSFSSQLTRQTVTKLPVTDAQSDASSADHCIARNFDFTNPASSSAAS